MPGLQWLFDYVLIKDNIVHAGAALCLIALLFRDQLALRAFLVAGDTIYILYYFFAPTTPLWGGIFWSSIYILTNAVMISRIIFDRAHFTLNDDEYALFSHLAVLTPGEFRRMMRLGQWRTASDPVVLTTEGEPVDRIYFVLAGDIAIEKSGRTIEIGPLTFIGEIAFLLSRPATATVRVGAGARYVSWDSASLRRLLFRVPALQIAFDGALNRDMAAKVARA
jgi:hypothetical protein